MKKLIVFIFLITLLSPLSAEWKIGQIVDDFGDTTGDEFAYFIVEDGLFSNSATKNSTSKVRIVAKFIDNVFPQILFIFEPHDYGWDNPINDFYTNSKSLLQFKNEKGSVIKFNEENSKYGISWNKIWGKNAVDFFEFIKNENSVKSAISCEGTRYNFTINLDGFMDAINYLIENRKSVKEISDWKVSVSDSGYSDYEFVSASKYFIINSNGNTYGVEFYIAGYPLDPEDKPRMNYELYQYNNPLYYFDDAEFSGVIFKTGSDKIIHKASYPSPYLSTSLKYDIEPKKIYSLLEKGKDSEIELMFEKPHNPIKFKLKSIELKNFLTYPYSDELMNLNR